MNIIKIILCLSTLFVLTSSFEHSVNFTIGNYTVPPNATTVYACKMFRMKDFLPQEDSDKKLQIFEIESIIASKQVHHSILVRCNKNARFNSAVERCENEMNENCTFAMGGFAHGFATIKYPPEAGFDFQNSDIFQLQIHYHNPTEQSFTDDSGIRVYYTDKIRPNSVGLTFMGKSTPKIIIPPKLKNYTITDTCNTTCFNKLPKEGFKLFGVLLHGHWYMRHMRLILKFANGTTDESTFRDDNYSFNNQYIKFIQNPMIIKPGDSITTVCGYDTSKVNSTVLGGPGSDNEMCLSSLFYYPAENGLLNCMESIGCMTYSVATNTRLGPFSLTAAATNTTPTPSH